MLPRSSNRADFEADVVESRVMRCCKLVPTIAFWIGFSVPSIAAIGLIAAFYFFSHEEVAGFFHTYFVPILYGGLSFLALCGVVFCHWQSDSIRTARNLRRTVLIRIPAFFTRYLRGHDPLRGVEISTIHFRRDPTTSFNAADCTVQIDVPELQQPLRSGSPALATESTSVFDSHPHTS